MKKLVFCTVAFCLIGTVVFFIKNKDAGKTSKVLPARISTETPIPSPILMGQSIVLNFKENPIRIAWASVNPNRVELYSNLKDQKLSEEIKVNKSCSVLVNGGFYSKTNTHLGLFITDFKATSPFSESALRNGFLSIVTDEAHIQDFPPDNNPRIAIQSGPLLMLNNQMLNLEIKNDQPDRRIVGATTKDGKLIFLALYRDNSEYQGPLLTDLPEIISLFKKESGIKISDAINLDGGSASAFISNYILLRELAYIGSYFCVK